MAYERVNLEALVTCYERALRQFLLGVVQDVELATDLCRGVQARSRSAAAEAIDDSGNHLAL
jgi:hypothetical protein